MFLELDHLTPAILWYLDTLEIFFLLYEQIIYPFSATLVTDFFPLPPPFLPFLLHFFFCLSFSPFLDCYNCFVFEPKKAQIRISVWFGCILFANLLFSLCFPTSTIGLDLIIAVIFVFFFSLFRLDLNC